MNKNLRNLVYFFYYYSGTFNFSHGLSAVSIAFGKPNVMEASLKLARDFGGSLQVTNSSTNCLFHYPASVE